jgi:DNA-binding CsgD family transcriptional regulator
VNTHPDAMLRLAELRQQDLHAVGVADRQARVSAHRLTRREREVLRLLVARYTDREIADALFISYRTATTHVARVRDKLGIRSRREAAGFADLANG